MHTENYLNCSRPKIIRILYFSFRALTSLFGKALRIGEDCGDLTNQFSVFMYEDSVARLKMLSLLLLIF